MYEKIFNLVRVIKQTHPELRVGQIMCIAANKAGWTDPDLFYCPDEILAQGLGVVLDQLVSE